MKNVPLKRLSIAMAVLALTGCAATQQANENYSAAQRTSALDFEGAKPRSAVAEAGRDPMSNFGRTTKNWVNPIPLPKMEIGSQRSQLPALFKKSVSLTMPGKVSLVEIASEIQRAQNINFIISQDVYSTAGGIATIITGAGGGSSEAKEAKPLVISDFVFRGSLESALDLLAAKANVSWKWNGSSVELFKYESKTYNISALSGDTSTNSSVGIKSEQSSGGGSDSNDKGAAGSGEQGVARKASLSAWGEIRSYLISQMSPQGTISVMESNGIVTIKDTPSVHAQLQRSIKDLNTLMSKQILVNVQIYSVTKASGDDFGMDWSSVWSNSSRVSGGLNTSTGATSSAPGQFSIDILKGPFRGTNLMLQALSTVGRASIVNEFSLATLNGQPTPVVNNRKIGYVESITAETSETGGKTTYSVTPGAVFSGIGMTITPKVQPDGKILMEYNMNLNDVEEITTFEVGGGDSMQRIQLPKTTVKNILQRAALRSGQTLVLSGFKQTVAKNSDSGVGLAKNPLLGGRQTASNDEQYLVITITPYVAQDNDE